MVETTCLAIKLVISDQLKVLINVPCNVHTSWIVTTHKFHHPLLKANYIINPLVDSSLVHIILNEHFTYSNMYVKNKTQR